eukprot:Pgem_evm1s14305
MLLVLQFLFAGFFITTSNIPVYWRYTVRYMSFFTYAFSSLAQNCYEGSALEPLLNTYEIKMNRWSNVGIEV